MNRQAWGWMVLGALIGPALWDLVKDWTDRSDDHLADRIASGVREEIRSQFHSEVVKRYYAPRPLGSAYPR